MDTRKLADYLANEIFSIPEEGRCLPKGLGPVRRIAFMAGTYYASEVDVCGLIKSALADRLQGILQRYDEAKAKDRCDPENTMKNTVKTDGNRTVEVRPAKYATEGFDVSICRNGWQSTVVTMDREMLLWLRDAITEQLRDCAA